MKQTIEVPQTKKGIVAATVLNVRNKPSLSGAIVEKLSKGVNVEIVESSEDWYRIGPNKWVNKLYITT